MRSIWIILLFTLTAAASSLHAQWEANDIVDVWRLDANGRTYLGPVRLDSDKNSVLSFGKNTRPLSWARAFCISSSSSCTRSTAELTRPSERAEYSNFLYLEAYRMEGGQKYSSVTRLIQKTSEELTAEITFAAPISRKLKLLLVQTPQKLVQSSQLLELGPEKFDSVRDSILSLGWFEDKKFVQAGTGFVIGDGSLLFTNHHVLSRFQDCVLTLSCTIAVVVEDKNKNFTSALIKVQVLTSQLNLDFAVLKRVDTDSRFRIPLKFANEVIGDAQFKNDGVYTLGYPVYGQYRAISSQGQIIFPSRANFRTGANRADLPLVFQTDMTIGPGHSGSPVLDSNMRVVGYLAMGRSVTGQSISSDQVHLKGIVFSLEQYMSQNPSGQPATLNQDQIQQKSTTDASASLSNFNSLFKGWVKLGNYSSSQMIWQRLLTLPSVEQRQKGWEQVKKTPLVRYTSYSEQSAAKALMESQTPSRDQFKLEPNRMYLFKIGQKRKHYHWVSLRAQTGYFDVESNEASIFNLVCLPAQKDATCTLTFKDEKASNLLLSIFGIKENLRLMKVRTQFLSKSESALTVRLELLNNQNEQSTISLEGELRPSRIQNLKAITLFPQRLDQGVIRVKGLLSELELLPFGDFWIVATDRLAELSIHCLKSFCSFEGTRAYINNSYELIPIFVQKDYTVVQLFSKGQPQLDIFEKWSQQTTLSESYKIEGLRDVEETSRLVAGAHYYRKKRAEPQWESDNSVKGSSSSKSSEGAAQSPWRKLEDASGLRAYCLETAADVLCVNVTMWNELVTREIGKQSDFALAVKDLQTQNDSKLIDKALFTLEQISTPNPYILVPLMLRSQNLSKRLQIQKSLIRQGVVRSVD